jgi:hypothetical protein
MNFRLNAGFHESLDSRDTAPPPLPPWLKGFLVTSKTKERMKDAGEEVAALLNGPLCKVAFDAAGGSYTSVEPLLVPGCPGTVFVALRPDDNDVDVRAIAEGIIEASDWAGVGDGFPNVSHVSRLIPVQRIAPETEVEALAKKVVAEHFPALDSPEGTKRWANGGLPTFAVRYEEHSPAMHLHARDVETRVANLVPPEYEVRLDRPDRVVLVVVAGGSVMMSVVEGYGSGEKFHRFRLGNSQPNSPVKARKKHHAAEVDDDAQTTTFRRGRTAAA